MQLADFFFAPPERKKKETFMQADVRKRNEKTKKPEDSFKQNFTNTQHK